MRQFLKRSLREEIDRLAWLHVTEGFLPNKYVVDLVSRNLEDQSDGQFKTTDDVRVHIAERVEVHSREHRQEENTWSYLTDCDKLDRMGKALDDSGIKFVQHSTYCDEADIEEDVTGTCGCCSSEYSGFAYYYDEDTVRAINEGQLEISFGGIFYNRAKVGEEVFKVAECVGLLADWDGNPDSPIEIININWERRRTHFDL